MQEQILQMYRVCVYNADRRITHSFRVHADAAFKAEEKVREYVISRGDYAHDQNIAVVARPAGKVAFYE